MLSKGCFFQSGPHHFQLYGGGLQFGEICGLWMFGGRLHDRHRPIQTRPPTVAHIRAGSWSYNRRQLATNSNVVCVVRDSGHFVINRPRVSHPPRCFRCTKNQTVHVVVERDVEFVHGTAIGCCECSRGRCKVNICAFHVSRFNRFTTRAQMDTGMVPGFSTYRYIVERETLQWLAKSVMVTPSRWMAFCISAGLNINFIFRPFLCRVPKTMFSLFL